MWAFACAVATLLLLAQPSKSRVPYRPGEFPLPVTTEEFEPFKTFVKDVGPSRVEHVHWKDVVPSLDSRCCWEEFHTAYDDQGPIGTIIDNLLCDPDTVRQEALTTHWNTYTAPADEDGANNAFPGWRGETSRETADAIVACVWPMVDAVWPTMKKRKVFKRQALANVANVYGLTTVRPQEMVNSQRLAHNDFTWEFGTDGPRGQLPKGLATVYGLTHDFNHTGTAFFRNKETGLSLLSTVEKMSGMWGKVTEVHKKLELSFRDGIAGYADIDNPWMQAIAMAPLRYNRITMYDIRRLHNIWMRLDDQKNMSIELETGRLTLNNFYRKGSKKFRRCNEAREGLRCKTCAKRQGCGWILREREGAQCSELEWSVRNFGQGGVVGKGFGASGKCPPRTKPSRSKASRKRAAHGAKKEDL